MRWNDPGSRAIDVETCSRCGGRLRITAVRGRAEPTASPSLRLCARDVAVRSGSGTALAPQLQKAGADLISPARTCFAGEPGEQRTMFVGDASGNALEFKAFATRHQVLATD